MKVEWEELKQADLTQALIRLIVPNDAGIMDDQKEGVAHEAWNSLDRVGRIAYVTAAITMLNEGMREGLLIMNKLLLD